MRILIIGSGGREHALAWKVSKSREVKEIFVAPGNAGTAWTKKTKNVDLKTKEELLQFAINNKIDLTIVGPEQFLVDGIVDLFSDKGLKIFGPSKNAAQLEGSKAFSKEFMRKYKVATARYHVTESPVDALNYIKEQNKFPVVIKADGLASGKGVFIANTIGEAEITINQYMVEDVFHGAGKKIVIEEFLVGVEASIICITDGNTISPFISAKDHKQVFDNNSGPNTGGMGAICPNKYFTKKIMDDFEKNIMLKTLEGIKDMRMKYNGFIFFGVMITKDGCKLLEYNVRMGDPECQSILPLMKSDLIDLIQYSLDSNLNRFETKWRKQYCVNAVITAKGYPGTFTTGEKIGFNNWAKKYVFIAGAKNEENSSSILSTGGRIMCVYGKSVFKCIARLKVYFIIKFFIKAKNIHYRTDIGIAN